MPPSICEQNEKGPRPPATAPVPSSPLRLGDTPGAGNLFRLGNLTGKF
ncbi:hypothetical protein U91I_02544 [alpha proteobacterium U9-1i]|nr:hypothetical protein U91I_02544 [alpha proteobacterium U9-1i]